MYSNFYCVHKKSSLSQFSNPRQTNSDSPHHNDRVWIPGNHQRVTAIQTFPELQLWLGSTTLLRPWMGSLWIISIHFKESREGFFCKYLPYLFAQSMRGHWEYLTHILIPRPKCITSSLIWSRQSERGEKALITIRRMRSLLWNGRN